MRVIQRGEWGAKGAKNPATTVWRDGGTLWVHHTEGTEPSPNASVETEKAVMRGLQRFHQETRGWSDIGYSYVIFPSGRIYEGRGYGVVGAHCPGHNTEPSAAFAGSYDDHLPTTEARKALSYVAKVAKARQWRGHREGFSTSCPGDQLYAWVKNNTPDYAVSLTPPAKPKPKKPKLSVYQRLRKAGFGVKSAQQILRKMGRIK